MARVCVDSRYFSVDNSGLLTFNPSSVGLQQMVVFTASGTFTKASYPGLLRVRVRVVGGGGGGAGAQAIGFPSLAQPSASGGGYSESVINAASLGASETVVVGAGGLGGVGNANGQVGGQSSFGATVTAPGGFGAAAAMPQGTFEVTIQGTSQNFPGTGQIAITGSPGGHAHRNGTDQSCQTYAAGDSGGGYGAGGGGRVSSGGGGDATGYGGGGAGAVSNGSVQRGGNGTPGIVIVELYY